MLKFKSACKMVAEGFTLEDLKYGKKRYSPQDQQTLRKVLLVENRIFQIYLKTGKYGKDNFPYNQLQGNYCLTNDLMTNIAKMILNNNWSPFTHVSKTREKFSTITTGFY